MSLTVSRLPSRLPTFNTATNTTNAIDNDVPTEAVAEQRTLPISKLQSPMSTKLKLPSAGIKNIPTSPSSSTSSASSTIPVAVNNNPVATTNNNNNAEPVSNTRLRPPLKLNNNVTNQITVSTFLLPLIIDKI